MAGGRSKATNSAESRPRAQSRASTTSVHSITTHTATGPAPEQEDMEDHHNNYPDNGQPYSPEGMLLQSAHQLSNPHGFPLDPSLGEPTEHTHQYPSAGLENNDSFASQAAGDFAPFDEPDTSMMDAANNTSRGDATEPTTSKGGKQTKKGSGSSAQNELELKRLYRENSARSLHEVAEQLHVDERGPQSEKIRQIFAMLWLNHACKKSSGSVPRGRVYSHYVSRCGTERVTVLNPASFGKLVRVMFPGIATRRLGMRGESKYHYCGLSLLEDQPSLLNGMGGNGHGRRGQSPSLARELSQHPQLPADTAAFPETSTVFETSDPERKTKSLNVSTKLFCDIPAQPVDSLSPDSTLDMVERELCFAPSQNPGLQENEPIDLPRIDMYLPSGTDPDTAAALTALYRSNCTSLIDAMRFCRQKAFFHLFTSFHGTLTVPVQKLMSNSAIAPWIQECDWLMYQKMIQVMAPLALQVIPKRVIDTLQIVSRDLVPHIKASFNSHPPHVLRARLGPATIFASLIDRLLRVNMAAHAAASILCSNATRDQMYEEWARLVDPYKVAQNELPSCGYTQTLVILSKDVRELLEPVDVSWEHGGMSDSQSAENPKDAMTDGLLDRWASFVTGIPERFPQADVRTVLTCVNTVTTAALRDITMGSGKSFGAWWVCKMWIDEMMGWMAERGGFMEHTAPQTLEERQLCGLENTSEGLSNSHGHRSRAASTVQSRFSSEGADRPNTASQHDPVPDSTNTDNDFGMSDANFQKFLQGDGTVSFGSPAKTTGQVSPNGQSRARDLLGSAGFDRDMAPDDSGVGMSDEYSIARWTLDESGTNTGVPERGPSTNNNNSNNGDLVVC